MKLVGSLSSYAVARAAPEELQPRNGIAWSELNAALQDRYKSTPVVMPPNQIQSQFPLVQQNGEFDTGSSKIAVEQIWISAGGAVAVANTTELAKSILSDLTYFLEHSFEFRFSSAKLTNFFVSDVVVQFENSIGDALTSIGKVEKIVADAMRQSAGEDGPVGLKRLSFGREVEVNIISASPLDVLDTIEFTIERRVKQPYSENKFYSRALLSTEEHLRVLTEIEDAFKGGTSV